MNEHFIKDLIITVVLWCLIIGGVLGGFYVSKYENFAKGYIQCVKDLTTKPAQQVQPNK